MAAQGALDQRAVFAGQQPAQLRLLQPVRTLRVGARVGAERDVCSKALRVQLQQQFPHLRVGGLRAQTKIQRQIQRTFHHQGHAGVARISGRAATPAALSIIGTRRMFALACAM